MFACYLSAPGSYLNSTYHRLRRILVLAGLVWLFASRPLVFAQQSGLQAASGGPEQAQPTVALEPQNGLAPGSQGGAGQADFDSLIDLIQSTVAAESWAANGTGDGEIAPFDINGVFVDSSRALEFSPERLALATLRKKAASAPQQSRIEVRGSSALRFVSLPRLEAAIAHRQQRNEPLLPEMLTLAGLQRVQYVMVYPETRDLVIAGPAGDWEVNPAGRIISIETGRPVVRLDDLLTLWRRKQTHNTTSFGCSIIPRQEALIRTQEFINDHSRATLAASQREDWLQDLRGSLGKQDVEFFGIEPNNHVSQVLLVADYHMKLIGMGIAEAVEGVASYLDSVQLLPDGSPPPMAVLRWWFAMNYQPVEISPQRDVYHLRGQGVQVLSENELLAERGRRVPTGQSEELNRRFAESFTKAFNDICQRYPLYGELRNVFDLALVVALIEEEGLPERIGWQPSLFSSRRSLRLPHVQVPREVDSVINHRVIQGRHIVAGVSGGVWIDVGKTLYVKSSNDVKNFDTALRLSEQRKEQEVQSWWWD